MQSNLTLALVLFAPILLLSGNSAAELRLGTWCELTTPRFQVFSDLPADALQQLLRDMERFADVAEPFLPGTPVPHANPLKVFVFAKRRDFRTLSGKRKFAGLMQPSLETNRLLIGPIRGSIIETALHEYAHYLLRNRLDVSLPTWFDEGLASLLGATRFDGERAVIGSLPTREMQRRTDSARPDQALRRALTADSVVDWPPQSIEEFYDWSWLITHYLYFGDTPHFDELAEYLEQRDASLVEYLDTTHRGLVRALERYVNGKVPKVEVASSPPAMTERTLRCLQPSERDQELAAAVAMQNPEMARELLESSLTGADTDADLLVILSRAAFAAGDREQSAALAAEALRTNRNANTMINSTDLSISDCLFNVLEACRQSWQGAALNYRAALKQDPNRFDAVLGLGLASLYSGQPGEAVNYLRVAYTRAPWSAVINFYLGETYRLVGDTRARRHLNNARNWSVQSIWQTLADESLKRMDELERAPVAAASDGISES